MTSRFYNAKEQLEKIRRLREQGLEDAVIAERLGIRKSTIHSLISRENRKADA
jgi:orotate phosphoribosyltransferase-like protein